ncbi:restriction endonuclease subunit S [Sphingopyxis fribergensis]
MAGKWQERKLGDVITLKRGYDLASAARRHGTVPILSSSGVSGFHDIAKVNGPGVVTGRYGTIGNVFYTDEDFWPLNTTLYVSDFKGSDARFVSYQLKTINFSAYSDKAAVPGINRNDLHEALVLWPPLGEQIAIAGVLAALDDKIDLNRQMAVTLEDMARALFKSWFVDFEPVHAKAEGRDTGLSAEIASLFPDSFGDDALPLGWQHKNVLELAHWVNGAAYKNMHFVDSNDGLPVIKIAELKSGITKQTKFSSTDLGHRYKIFDGELLFSWSGSPETSIDSFVWTNGEAWLNQHIFAVRENGEAPKALHYAMLKYLKPRFVSIARDKQTTGLGHVTKDDMKIMFLGFPPTGTLFILSQQFDKIFERYINVLRQQNILEELRSTLLPKLLSGELGVAGVETVIAAA